MKLSIVIPFYKRAEQFAAALKYNAPYLAKPDYEIVLVVDEPTQQEQVLKIVEAYAGLNWKVLLNPNDHAWRNPSPPLNVGIRHATGDHVLVTSPESMFVTDVPSILLNAIEGKEVFAIGRVRWCSELHARMLTPVKAFAEVEAAYYGSICVAREYLLAIRGYDESLTAWGGDDDNLRRRLQLHGIAPLKCPDAKLIHFIDEPREVLADRHIASLDAILFPRVAAVNDENWGTDFNQIIYP